MNITKLVVKFHNGKVQTYNYEHAYREMKVVLDILIDYVDYYIAYDGDNVEVMYKDNI